VVGSAKRPRPRLAWQAEAGLAPAVPEPAAQVVDRLGVLRAQRGGSACEEAPSIEHGPRLQPHEHTMMVLIVVGHIREDLEREGRR